MFLVLRSQTGDREAMNELLQAVQSPLYRYISRLTGEQTLAEDILQEVFIIIYRKIGWLQDPKLFRAWAYRIASREVFRRLKKEKQWKQQFSDDETFDQIPAHAAPAQREPELLEKIPALLSQVSPASRAVLALHYLEELPLSETAEILEIAVGTAKSRLAYGLETMRRLIKKEI